MQGQDQAQRNMATSPTSPTPPSPVLYYYYYSTVPVCNATQYTVTSMKSAIRSLSPPASYPFAFGQTGMAIAMANRNRYENPMDRFSVHSQPVCLAHIRLQQQSAAVCIMSISCQLRLHITRGFPQFLFLVVGSF